MTESNRPGTAQADRPWLAAPRRAIKRAIPPAALNGLLLKVPSLYGLGFVNYETNLPPAGVEDLLSQLDATVRVEGDIAECGCSRCGATVIAARRLAQQRSPRRIFACDSFTGFDPDELERERAAGDTDAPPEAFTSTSLDYVRNKLAALKVDDVVDLVPGYFEETLPSLSGPFSLVFVDCDLYDSLLFCARTLWPQLSSGGRMLFDDYTSPEFRSAKPAVDAFVAERANEISEHRLLGSLYLAVKA